MPRLMSLPLPLLSLLCLAAGSAQADTVVITADRMLDVVSGRMVDHPQITITDGRITAVGSKGATAPADARHVDLLASLFCPR